MLRYLLLALLGALLLWVALSVAKHHQDVHVLFSEFLSTWPAARVTETFKLMSLWGVMVEYGIPQPRQEPADRRSSFGSPTSASPATPHTAKHVDDKRVPLLAAAH